MPDPASPVRALPLGEPSLRPLSPDGLARMHAASLRILEETGVAVGSVTVRDRLAAAGARVDGIRVRLPAVLVEAALGAAPRSYTLAAREPAWDLPLDGAHGYLSVDGSAAEILDQETGARETLAPARQVYGEVNWRFQPHWQLNARVKWIFDPFDHALADLALRRTDVADHMDFTLLVNNLFDVEANEPSLFSQALPDGVPLPGRNVMAQIRYRF